MLSQLQFRTLNAVHRAMLRLSGGRLGREVAGMPVINLTTTGRSSGLPRTTLLTVPHREPMPEGQPGERLVIIASRGGDDRHPAWYLNLEAEPTVQVASWGEHPQPHLARTAHPDERARLWPLAVQVNPGYAGYQRKTEREIPVVILEPAPAP